MVGDLSVTLLYWFLIATMEPALDIGHCDVIAASKYSFFRQIYRLCLYTYFMLLNQMQYAISLC